MNQDPQLVNERTCLEEYVREGSPQAFAHLVERYASLVHSMALRRLGDSHLAEDVTQAVFLLLSRRARTIDKGTAIAGWLCRATQYTAANAMRIRRRRTEHERRAAMERPEHVAPRRGPEPADATDVWPLLDAAMDRLGDRERDAVLLRYFEMKSVGQIASDLGIAKTTAAKRLARAVSKLKKYFRAHRIELSEMGLASALTGSMLHDAPPRLVASVLANIARFSNASGQLAAATTLTMLAQKLKAVAVLMVVGTVMIATVTVAVALQNPTRNDRAADNADSGAIKPPAARPAKPGKFVTTFTERHPLSTIEAWKSRRSLGSFDSRGIQYDLSRESFEVYVPRAYASGERPFGLLVWVSASESGDVPENWNALMDRTRMIWISANNTGNRREFAARVGLAMDAAHNMKSRYNLDSRRIYIGGFSGGGLVTAELIRGFPEQFSGAICVMGGQFYLPRQDPGGDVGATVIWLGCEWPFDQARRQLRLMLMTSDRDEARQRMQADYTSFALDDFQYVSFLQIPNVGHAMPNATWMEKAIAALDKHPPVPPTTRGADAAPPPTTAALTGIGRQLPRHDPDAQAERLLNSARAELDNSIYARSEQYARQILDDFPGTPAAIKAKFLLDQIAYIKRFAAERGRNFNSPSASALFRGRVSVTSGYHDLARIDFERAIALESDSQQAREAKAWIEWMDKNPAARRAEPTDRALLASVLFQSGLGYAAANRPTEARDCFQRIVREFPTTPAAAEARKQLSR